MQDTITSITVTEDGFRLVVRTERSTSLIFTGECLCDERFCSVLVSEQEEGSQRKTKISMLGRSGPLPRKEALEMLTQELERLMNCSICEGVIFSWFKNGSAV